jgi:phosphoribosyl 1,2-cyclic phosphate phosphodiesterase
VKVEILGSAGATTAPRPGCRCRVCVEARDLGGRHARTGPSTFVHGANILFDTPEESRLQLARAAIDEIGACFYSHWHPDHTMGRRVWETRNVDFRGWPPETKQTKTTDVYLPQQVAEDMRTRLGHWEHFTFMEAQGWVRVHVLRDGESVTVGGVEVRPFRLAEDYVYAFELHAEGKRVLVAPDELNGWSPPSDLRGLDLAVLPMGIAELDPLTGERRIHLEHPVLRYEATFEETLEIVDSLGAARVVLSHIEEIDGLTVDDLSRLEERLRAEGRPVTFAWDGLVVPV